MSFREAYLPLESPLLFREVPGPLDFPSFVMTSLVPLASQTPGIRGRAYAPRKLCYLGKPSVPLKALLFRECICASGKPCYLGKQSVPLESPVI